MSLVSKGIWVATCNFNKIVAQILSQLHSVLCPVCLDLPLEIAFFRMELHRKDGILFGLPCRNVFLSSWRYGCSDNLPEVIEQWILAIRVCVNCPMLVEIRYSWLT